MNSTLAELPLQKRKSMREQIREQMRELIVSGRIEPGEQLPSTEALAGMWGTHAPTVHQGLTALVKEGLLERRHGLGTFVREREARLERVAIYVAGPREPFSGSAFSHSVFERVLAALVEAGIEVDVRIDPRPQSQEYKAWNPLRRAARDREFQAIIAPMAGRPTVDWLTRLQVPVSYFGLTVRPMQVTIDHEQFVKDGLARLAAQGCSRVGMIASIGRTLSQPEQDLRAHGQTIAMFVAQAAALGMRAEREWLRVPLPSEPVGGVGQVRYGREQLHALWSLAERPDGLIVGPDTMAQGVILALAERQLRPPTDLRLVLQRNAGHDYFCPYGVTDAIVDERQLAAALLAQVQRQFRGEPVEPQRVRLSFAEHAADGSPYP
jgi:DNA-binding transcriptional regulator YhcF (GntR family)/DNA-binding LacI/PurR family transcriptional regulator